MIRENQAIRANLRIDSRESGHLSSGPFFDNLSHIFWSIVVDFLVKASFIQLSQDFQSILLNFTNFRQS